MNIVALLHDSPSNPPRKPLSSTGTDVATRGSQPSPQTVTHPLPPHKATSPAMSSLHPHPEAKAGWPQTELRDREEQWERDRRERADSGPLPSMRNSSILENRPASLPQKNLSQRDMDMSFIRAAANARQHQQGNLAEILVMGPGPTPRPSSSSGRTHSSLIGVGTEMGRERERGDAWERMDPHPHSQQHRLPPPPHPHQARPMAAPVPMHVPRDIIFDQRERRDRDLQEVLRKDQGVYGQEAYSKRRSQQNPHPIPQHHAVIGRHGPPSRTSSAGLMEGRLSGASTRAAGDEHAFHFLPNHRGVDRESEHARSKRREREKEKEIAAREVKEPPKLPPPPSEPQQHHRMLFGAAKRSLGVLEDMVANVTGLNANGITSHEEPNSKQETNLGRFIWPNSPFPFFFPEHHSSKPHSFVATIYIPSGCLPLNRPERSKIWGGGASTRKKQTGKRTYTDDSDIFLCALHSGWVTWSGTRKAREEGRDLEVQVKVVRCLGDIESAIPEEPFLGLFVGGWGERYKFAGPKGSRSLHRKQRKGVTREDNDSLFEPKKRLQELTDGREESDEDDDGRSLVSAGWGTSHDGSGIEILSAQFVQKGTTRHFGRLNRRQRLAEYSQRRATLFSPQGLSKIEAEEMEIRTIVFGQTSDVLMNLGFKYDPKRLKRVLFSNYLSQEELKQPRKRRKITKSDDSMDVDESSKTQSQIVVETPEDCYVFCRRDNAELVYDLAIKVRQTTKPTQEDKQGSTLPSITEEALAVEVPVEQIPEALNLTLTETVLANAYPVDRPTTPSPASPKDVDSIASTPTRETLPPTSLTLTISPPNPIVISTEAQNSPPEGAKTTPQNPVATESSVTAGGPSFPALVTPAPDMEVEDGEVAEEAPSNSTTAVIAQPSATVQEPIIEPSGSVQKLVIETPVVSEMASARIPDFEPPVQTQIEPKTELKIVREGFGEDAVRFTDDGIEILGDAEALFLKVERWKLGM